MEVTCHSREINQVCISKKLKFNHAFIPSLKSTVFSSWKNIWKTFSIFKHPLDMIDSAKTMRLLWSDVILLSTNNINANMHFQMEERWLNEKATKCGTLHHYALSERFCTSLAEFSGYLMFALCHQNVAQILKHFNCVGNHSHS